MPDDKENILNRDFKADTINQKWCTDITYIHVLKEGWTYLASVMDLCSRKIIGYAYSTSMTAELALEAVKNACRNVKKQRELFCTVIWAANTPASSLRTIYVLQKSDIPLAVREILMIMPVWNPSIRY